MTSLRDKNGKRLNRQQQQKPRWPEPYETPIEIAGFQIVKYLGYRRYGSENQGMHWYRIKCIACGAEYERAQGTLTRAVAKETRGCRVCAKKRFKADKAASKEAAEWETMHSFYEWTWVNFLMPVASLRMRDEVGRSFDSENSKVMGWNMI